MRFCGQCAGPLAAACPSCGSANPPGNKFCGHCAAPLAGTTPRVVTPDSYTPKHLAERIINSKAALEGERKQVTVLFADLKGSMELLADRDPEEARKILDPVLERMMEAIHHYEGTVNQVMGDGIMALFGAPLAHEDHAVRACYAALRMQEALRRYAEDVFRRYGVPVEIRVGLNSGEVVVRAIGSDLHMDYTAVGQTTHLAARMEQMARPGIILLAPDTLTLAEGFVQVTSRGPVPVKGLVAPIEIFELVGASPVRSRLHAAAARGLTRFVGRDAEFELLRQALGRAGEGHGQVVAVVGEPGVGKSRLLWEFTHSHRSQGWLVLETTSVSYGKATTYFPVLELLRRYFGVEPRDDNRKMREKVTGKLLSLDRALESTLPVFLSLLDVPGEDGEWTKLDPSHRRRQTLDALKRLLLRESQVQPVLLVVEDLHWIDTETQAWLDLLVESLPTARFLLLANYRPEYRHAWGSKMYYQQVRLDALPTASADELLEALLGSGPGLEDLRRLLIARTQGNPFFLEESVRVLVETRALSGERGAYHLAGPIQSLQLPATAQAILAARIDRLPPGDKRLLQAAAVIGTDVPITLLEAIAEEPEEHLREGLARLQAAEFLYEARLFPELEYTFKHALTHEVAYQALLHERRQRLHADVVAAIEAIRSDRLADHVEQLARHAMRGELWEKAATYGAQAGWKSLARAAYQDAATHLEQALEANSRLPEGPDTLAQAIDIRMGVRGALLVLLKGADGLKRLLEAEPLAVKLGDRARLSALATVLSHHMRLDGRTPEARRYAHTAVQHAEDLGDPKLIVSAHALFSTALLYWGEYADAEIHAKRALSLIDHYPDNPTHVGVHAGVSARYALSMAHAERGDFDAALRVGADDVRVAEALRQPFSLMHAVFFLAWVHAYRGAFDVAAGLCERALSIARDIDVPFLTARMKSLSGYVKAMAGATEIGLAEARTAVDLELTHGFRGQLLQAVWVCAEIAVLSGRLDEGEQHARQAMSVAVEAEARGTQARICRLLGEIATLRDPPAEAMAIDQHRKALSLANELGMRPLIAHCHLGLGKLYRRTEKPEQAQEHLVTATTMYREMGMTYWLEKACDPK
jgi:class 3 adenylate cyclase